MFVPSLFIPLFLSPLFPTYTWYKLYRGLKMDLCQIIPAVSESTRYIGQIIASLKHYNPVRNYFPSQLSTNKNNFHQKYFLQTKTEKSTSPTKPILPIMSPPTNTRNGSSNNITILLKPPQFPHHFHHLCQNLTLKPYSNKCFLDLI